MKKTNYKPKLLKHSYLKEEVDHSSELFSEYLKQLMEDCPEYVKYMTDLEDKKKQSEEEDEEEEKKTKHKDLKKIYRRISKVTHPDKTNSKYLEKLFKQSSEDYQENRIGSLFSTAVQLEIDVSDLDMKLILDKMDLEITTYEENLEKFQSSFPWKWAHAETQEEKDFLREQANLFFGVKNED